MPSFALRYPYFVIMFCMMLLLVGVVNVSTMPVDLFPKIDIPVVVVATFYAGMPPEQIEADITDTFERFFTLGANIDHIESRSLTGVSLVKVYFQPGTDANSALSNIANLAMADLRRLAPGTLPPVVLGMTASSQPVCLVTLKGNGLNETRLKDLAQFEVRDQIANVTGASVPQPFGGRYRQIQVYVDPLKLEAHNMSLMDVVHSVNQSNLILPAGDVRIGVKDYNIYTNSQFPTTKGINSMPLKSAGNSSVLVADVGHAEDGSAIQTNIVRIDGQRSVYIPVFKQGGKSNTIEIVKGMRGAIKKLTDVPDLLRTAVMFDQSVFVKGAIKNLLKEAGIGLGLTSIMILIFLGNPRATIAVLLSIPLSALTCLLIIGVTGGSLNTMLLGGLALSFSLLIDDSVVVLENIFRLLEEGKQPEEAAREGATQVALPVLAATSAISIVFSPIFLLKGVSKYLFTDLAVGVVVSICASYLFAMTVVPLFVAKFIHAKQKDTADQKQEQNGNENQSRNEGQSQNRVQDQKQGEQQDHSQTQDGNDGDKSKHKKPNIFVRFSNKFNELFQGLLNRYEAAARRVLKRPGITAVVLLGIVAVMLVAIVPFLGRAYFPKTDPGQFVINVKLPSGTRIEVSDQYVGDIEKLVRSLVRPKDMQTIVSNIGVQPDISAIYTTNAAMDTAFIQVSLKQDHSIGTFKYMDQVRARLASDMPEIGTYVQSGGLIDSVVNQGLPAPIDVEVSSNDQKSAYAQIQQLENQLRGQTSIQQLYIPQDLKYPGLELDVDRERASLIGLSPETIVDNVITALTSDGVIAPSYWIDPKNGNNYMLTVQYTNQQIGHMNMEEFEDIPLHAPNVNEYTPLRSVAFIRHIDTPTEVDHYQLKRVIDLYIEPSTEALNTVNQEVNKAIAGIHQTKNMRIVVHGAVNSMKDSFERFGLGLLLAIVLVYLVLMAQFTSLKDPFIILMAIPPGLAGVAAMLLITGSTLNIMSLMGLLMMTGIVTSNSILIVQFATELQSQGKNAFEAVIQSCRIRMRPILMTALATLLGMIPMALGLEAGSQQYAPLARAIIGGLGFSVVFTIFLVPAVYLLIHGKDEPKQAEAEAH